MDSHRFAVSGRSLTGPPLSRPEQVRVVAELYMARIDPERLAAMGRLLLEVPPLRQDRPVFVLRLDATASAMFRSMGPSSLRGAPDPPQGPRREDQDQHHPEADRDGTRRSR